MFIVSALWKYSSSIYNAYYLLHLFVVSLFFSIIHLFLTIFLSRSSLYPWDCQAIHHDSVFVFLRWFLCENETDRDSSPCFRNHSKIDTDARLLSCEHTWWAGSCFPSFFCSLSPSSTRRIIYWKSFARRTDRLKKCIWFTSCSMSHKNIKQKIQFAPFLTVRI